MKSKGTKIREKEFKQLKSLLTAGVPLTVVGKTMRRCACTLIAIKKAKDYADFRRSIFESWQKRKAKKGGNGSDLFNPLSKKGRLVKTGNETLVVLREISNQLNTLIKLWS